MRKIVNTKDKREYVLQSVLGQGSFGKVYYSPPYAIKQIRSPSYYKHANQNQTTILKQLDHPNIVKLYDIFKQGGSVFMVMEYCQMDLSHYININREKINEQKAIEIFKQVVLGLNYLVQRGVIHRDLKPANILVNNRNEFKLADFGLARKVQEYDHSMLQTIVGTPLYMAPQLLKKSKYTTKCDIWSTGIIFYELLMGRLPWMASNQMQLYQNILNKPLEFPRNISEWSKNVLSKMIVVNEQDRIGWQDLFDMVKIPRPKSHSRSRRPSNAKSQTNISQISPKKIVKPCLAFPANKLKEMLIVDMQQFFDDVTVNKILSGIPYRLNAEQISKVRQLFSCYNPQLQAWFLKDVPNFRICFD